MQLEKKRATLKDVSKAAGVSIAAVSYVLNNHPMAARIGQEKVELIQKTAKRLNYRPNQIAKSLKNQKTFTIGLIVADISNPFSASIANYIEDNAKKKGYTVFFGSSGENLNKTKDLIETMLDRNVDGLIVTPIDNSEPILKELVPKGFPLVLVDRFFKSKFDFVGIDNFQATYDAIKVFVQNGRSRIGFISYETELMHIRKREEGYKKALEEEGITFQKDLLYRVSLNSIESDVKSSIDKMLGLSPPCDAIFFATNTLGYIGIRHLTLRQIDIPNDLALISFDKSDFYDFLPFEMTYIKQPLQSISIQALDLLFKQMDSKQSQAKEVVLGAELIIGNSSG